METRLGQTPTNFNDLALPAQGTPLGSGRVKPAQIPIAWRQRSLLGALFVFYAALLLYHYIHFITPIWGYLGFVSGPSVPGLLLAVNTLIGALPALWLPIHVRRISDTAVWLLYVLVVLPTAVMGIVLRPELELKATVISAVLVGLLLALQLIARVPNYSRSSKVTPSPSFLVGLVGVTILLLTVTWFTFDRGISLGVLQDVRTTRHGARETIQEGGQLGAYARLWLGKVAAPMLVVMGLYKRRAGLIVLGMAAGLVAFSAAANISILLGVPASAGFFLAIRRFQGRNFGFILGGALVAVVLVGIGLSMTQGRNFVTDEVLKRGLVTPALVQITYFEFFEEHGEQLNLPSPFSSARGENLLPRRVGADAGLPTGTHMNGGVWADSYAGFGFTGVLTATLLLGWVLRFANGRAHRLPLEISLPCLVLPAWSVCESALSSALFSHGVLLTILALTIASNRFRVSSNH